MSLRGGVECNCGEYINHELVKDVLRPCIAGIVLHSRLQEQITGGENISGILNRHDVFNV